ncbi:MAG: hypothetical protein DRP06_01280 [Candidatus Aenigmatarchaeota archaeon]|nr:MAG: hypothetical protein DRP06_01280 [Candidatus Aenigmarchaeota archaeon]
MVFFKAMGNIKHEETRKMIKIGIMIALLFILFCIVLLILAKIYLPEGILSNIDLSGFLDYGYFGLFVITFFGGTFFPAGSPAVVAAAGVIGMNKTTVAFVSAAGYTLGTLVNYAFAYWFGIHYVQKKMGKEVYKEVVEWWNGWGTVLLITFALIPILPFSYLALLCGLFRYNIAYFILINFGSNLLNSYIFVYLGSSVAGWIGLF